MLGKWIWIDKAKKEDEYVTFYQEISYSSGRVNIKLSCDSNYFLNVNGKLAGFGQYCDYPYKKSIETVDLTNFLIIGKNQIEITVWHYGRMNFSYYQSNAGLIFYIENDGKIIAESSEQTDCYETAGFISGLCKNITWQLGFSYTYDTNKGKGKVQKAVCVEKEYSFFDRPIKPLIITESIQAQKILDKNNIYDLGKETTGFLKINFKADKDSIVKIMYGEHLTDGAVRWRMDKFGYDYSFLVEIIGCGEEKKLLLPLRILGGRYLQIDCDNSCQINYVGIEEVLYPVKEKGFIPKDEKRAEIYKTAVRTLRLCMHQHYEDCPWREQAYYSTDGGFEMLYGYYAFEGTEYQRANLELMLDSDRKDGLLPICAPSSTNQVIPSFALSFINSLVTYYEFSKDVEFIKKCYVKAEKILSVFENNIKEGLVYRLSGDGIWNFYEWTPYLGGEEAIVDSALNLAYSMALSSMEKLSEILDLSEKVKEYQQRIKYVNEAINKTFYDEAKGLYKTFIDGKYHKLINAWAIISGVADEERAKGIADKLVNDKELIDITLSMSAHLYNALLKVDVLKYKDYVLSEIDGKYKYMLDNGATSFWETIKGESDFNGAGSLCHGWSALPIYFYEILHG